MYFHVVVLLISSWLLLAQPTLGTKNVTENVAIVTANSFNGTKLPSCPATCGNLTFPYPFGIGLDCSFDSNFTINCNNSKPFLGSIEVLSISPKQVRLQNNVASSCYDQTGAKTTYRPVWSWAAILGPYTISDKANKFMVVGCDVFGQISGFTRDEAALSTGCGSQCSKSTHMIDASNCPGIGCCQTDIPKGLKTYIVDLRSVFNHTKVWSFNKCSYAFVGDQNFRNLSEISDPTFKHRVAVVLDYAIGNKSCVDAQKNSTAYLCKGNNTLCIDNTDSGYGGYHCSCKLNWLQGQSLSDKCWMHRY